MAVLRLSEMLDQAQAGDDTALKAFMQRIVDGGKPLDGELANAYDIYLYRKMAEAIIPRMEKALTDALKEELPPLLRMQGFMGSSTALEMMRRKTSGR